jgi:hypothetical protein
LEKQNAGEIKDYLTLTNSIDEEFIIRPASDAKIKKLVKNNLIKEIINEFSGLAYLFIGKSGMLCEMETTEIVKATQIEQLNKKLKLLHELSGVLR